MTTNILTPAELDAIRERCEAATEGPWAVVVKGNTVKSHAIPGVCSGISPKTGNAEFIAHARSDIPRLLAHVAALEAELVRWLPVDKDTQTYSVTAERTQP